MRVRLSAWIAVWVAGAAWSAHAQVGEHGAISTRSDVKMAVEGATGTSGKRLEALAGTLSAPLATIKRCYAELVKERPEVVGTLPLSITLPQQGKLSVQMADAPPELKPMRKCIDLAFAKIDMGAVPRPAAAHVSLALTNTAAGSVDEVRSREADARKIVVEERDGLFFSRGTSAGGEVSFEVKGRDKAQVEKTHALARDALPGLFDCRRRASKLASPEGEIALALAAGGTISVKSSTVPNERAPTCATGALKRARGGAKPVAELMIRFSAPP